MLLTPEQVESYNQQGYLFLESAIPKNILNKLNAEIPAVFAEDSPRRVFEKDNRTIRSIYAPHFTNNTFDQLKSYSRLLNPVMQLLNNEVYLHQYKINVKAGLAGEMWNWHQDYVYWEKEDGIAKPELINVSVYLDEVTEFNGPLAIIPGSHRLENMETVISGSEAESDEVWQNHLSVDLKYTLDKPLLRKLVNAYDIVAPKGPAGSVLIFNPLVAHASAPNISPFDRKLLIMTYNAVNNLPQIELTRPDFLAGRDFNALEVLEHEEWKEELLEEQGSVF
ncbi:phytanoyl-CoA dioxygenase family protein [Paenibacillus sp. QZ-Y1]|uniref:phytanoyl-CoA dioxygenase family protein n=1 Tax=Paenibacillus sp. QZ-Y1 TaxID=3414511 RepID=UPI003F7AF788